jgi:hypothetical protein
MFFKIKGKIINIDENTKKIKLLLYNTNDIEHFNHILTLLKQNPNENNIYTMKIINKTKYNIDSFILFNNINDLLNLNVIISGYTKYYCFNLNKKQNDDEDLYNMSDINEESTIIKGNSFIINKITNYKDNN